MNTLDKQYLDLLQEILDKGNKKTGRNGNTISLFGKQIRHKMSDGFPLLTTKKMYFKGIVTELLWFLRGDTNIKYLVDNDCHIWDGDAYKNYCKAFEKEWVGKYDSSLGEHNHSARPMSKEEFIEKIKTDSTFANQWEELGPIYGKQWRKWSGFIPHSNGPVTPYTCTPIDQLQNLINTLKTNPDDRRMMVTAWNPSEIDKAVLPPCHYGFQVYTRELSLEERKIIFSKRTNNRIHLNVDNELLDEKNVPKRAISLLWNQRSVDDPLGLPFNIASYGLLLEILGKIVNMVPDELIGFLGDTHIYENQIEGVKEQVDRYSFDLPKLYVNTEFWLTESGECGVGPLTSNLDSLLNSIQISDFQIQNYKSHPSIKFPLSN